MENNTSLGKGILGAVIGSLPGLILWVILGYFGWTVGYVGLLIAFGVTFGYMKMGGEMSKAGAAVCIVTLLVTIYLGVHLSWSMYLFDMRPNLGLGTCIFGLFDYIIDAGEFVKSLLIGYVFGILGASGVLKQML